MSLSIDFLAGFAAAEYADGLQPTEANGLKTTLSDLH
jgi:hypothetical protein